MSQLRSIYVDLLLLRSSYVHTWRGYKYRLKWNRWRLLLSSAKLPASFSQWESMRIRRGLLLFVGLLLSIVVTRCVAISFGYKKNVRKSKTENMFYLRKKWEIRWVAKLLATLAIFIFINIHDESLLQNRTFSISLNMTKEDSVDSYK